MARLTVFCVLLFCVFGTTMAIKNPFHFIWKPNHCVEVYPANCFDICGKGHCLNRYKCCHRIFSFFDTFCEDKQELQRLCLPFVCKNNGTLFRTQASHHGHGYHHRKLSLCNEPKLKCACPTGYSGACCQSRTNHTNPCAKTTCSVGKCVVIYGRAVCKSAGRASINNTEAPTYFHETVNPDIVTEGTREDNIELEATPFVDVNEDSYISTDSTAEEVATDEPSAIY
ncbi:adhesive plaque matrix protein 2-like [Corticium candelabrum]|uniref:adhesive plaque matrix protein 2-like n=1 Tax=Corticium candelabrum TaxID=121492 RepID=UPI002E2578BE|nr:adhesive plaque matrix protein 2-like [Corticium candelabrum]